MRFACVLFLASLLSSRVSAAAGFEPDIKCVATIFDIPEEQWEELNIRPVYSSDFRAEMSMYLKHVLQKNNVLLIMNKSGYRVVISHPALVPWALTRNAEALTIANFRKNMRLIFYRAQYKKEKFQLRPYRNGPIAVVQGWPIDDELSPPMPSP